MVVMMLLMMMKLMLMLMLTLMVMVIVHLMPGNNAAMACRLAEQLVVPKPVAV